MKFSLDEIKVINSTCRTKGAVGKNAVVPRFVKKLVDKDQEVLDYGAGTNAIHTAALRAEGYLITAWDVGENFNPSVHDPNALKRKFNVVYASNVLNVQVSEEMLERTLKEIKTLLKKRGRFIFNYPQSPRKLNKTSLELQEVALKYFSSVTKLDKNVFMAKL